MDYQDFRSQYEIMHPASVPIEPRAISEYPGWLQWAVLAMFICSALLSGVHTIPTAYSAIPKLTIVSEEVRVLIANLSFVAVEIAIMACAYALSRKFHLVILVTLIAVIVIAMAANIDSVLTALRADETGKQIVAVILGIGAPLIAFTSGEMFVRIYRSSTLAELRAHEKYREDQRAWDEIVYMAFNDYEEKRKNEERVEREEQRKLEEKARRAERRQSRLSSVQPSNGQSNGQDGGASSSSASTRGHTKVPDASRRAEAHFTEHPEDLGRKPRDLENVIGVGKSTINNVQRQMRNNLTSNGHHDVSEEGESE